MKMRSGFTMLELMIVMVILMLMMSLAVASATSLRDQAEVRGSVDRYRAKHAMARTVAVRMGRTARLQLDTAGGRIWIEVERSKTERDTIGGLDSFDSGIRIGSSRTVVCFDARGMAKQSAACEAPNATVTFRGAGRADTVRTSAIGEIIR